MLILELIGLLFMLKMVKEYISIALFLVLVQIKKIIVNEIINANIYRIQAYDSLMCKYFCIKSNPCIGFNFFIIKKKLADLNNLFFPNNFKKS